MVSPAPQRVRDAGEYAVRGGILDLFAPGMAQPVRLDFFGDTLESIRAFDPESQRTLVSAARPRSRADERGAAHQRVDAPLPSGLCRRASARRRAAMRFMKRSAKAAAIPATSIGCRCSTIISTRSSITPAGRPVLDTLVDEAAHERIAQIDDYYDARKSAL